VGKPPSLPPPLLAATYTTNSSRWIGNAENVRTIDPKHLRTFGAGDEATKKAAQSPPPIVYNSRIAGTSSVHRKPCTFASRSSYQGGKWADKNADRKIER
jgi:hypothetical protein